MSFFCIQWPFYSLNLSLLTMLWSTYTLDRLYNPSSSSSSHTFIIIINCVCLVSFFCIQWAFLSLICLCLRCSGLSAGVLVSTTNLSPSLLTVSSSLICRLSLAFNFCPIPLRLPCPVRSFEEGHTWPLHTLILRDTRFSRWARCPSHVVGCWT